jgi:kumamolisin
VIFLLVKVGISYGFNIDIISHCKMIAIPNSARPRPETCRLLREVGLDEKIAFAILLHPHQNAPALPDLEYWQRTPLWERKFPTEEERAKMYCSSPEDMKAVISYVEQHGMVVLDQQAISRAVTVEASAAQIKAAFQVQLQYFEAETPLKILHKNSKSAKDFSSPDVETHHGYDGNVYVPAELKDIVKHVVGLDNRSFGAPGISSGDPDSSIYLPVPRIAELYNFPQLDASNQTIGIFNATGSYLESDIEEYFRRLPAGYNMMPKVVEVPLTVGSIQYKNQPDEVKNVSTYLPTQEINLDIQTSATIAQGCTVNVYFTENTELGWNTFLSRILLPETQKTEKTPMVVTSSWMRLDEFAYGEVLSEKFVEMAAAGILMFGISGDWGAGDGVNDGKEHVGSPSTDPYVTCCGGTVVGHINNGPPVTFDEYAWSDVHHAGSAFGTTDNSGWGSTGGGMSRIFPTPLYQADAGITSFKDSAGNVIEGGRFIPDISGMVGYTGFVINGGDWNLAGTSAVAPLYAGLFATIKSAIRRPIGLLNPTLYQLGSGDAFRDVTFGNNDSVIPIDSPYFSAGRGYDPTTGWGSIDGRKMLRAIMERTIPPLGKGDTIVGVLLGGVAVDGGGSIILPGGHIVPIDPWEWRTLSQVLTIAQASERLTGRAKIQIVGEMYKDLGKIIEGAVKALRESKEEAGN